MKTIKIILTGFLFVLIQTQSYATETTDLFNNSITDAQEYLLLAAKEDRKDRRDERGRSDERQDKRDCRQEEGRVGKDKRDCKQEEVRDGVRGKQGDRF